MPFRGETPGQLVESSEIDQDQVELYIILGGKQHVAEYLSKTFE